MSKYSDVYACMWLYASSREATSGITYVVTFVLPSTYPLSMATVTMYMYMYQLPNLPYLLAHLCLVVWARLSETLKTSPTQLAGQKRTVLPSLCSKENTFCRREDQIAAPWVCQSQERMRQSKLCCKVSVIVNFLNLKVLLKQKLFLFEQDC